MFDFIVSPGLFAGLIPKTTSVNRDFPYSSLTDYLVWKSHLPVSVLPWHMLFFTWFLHCHSNHSRRTFPISLPVPYKDVLGSVYCIEYISHKLNGYKLSRLITSLLFQVPNETISQQWRFKSWPDGHYSTVTMKLSQDLNCTTLTLSQTGVPESEAERTKQGWVNYYWNSIKQTFGYAVDIAF